MLRHRPSLAKVICISALSLLIFSAADQKKYVVIAPLADLRSEPSLPSDDYSHDPNQESQVLYGEHIKFIRTEGSWVLIEAIEQKEYTHNKRWQGYPGWVLINQIRPAVPDPKKNESIVIAKWARIWKDPQARYELFDLPMGAKLYLAEAKKALCKVRLVDGFFGWTSCSNIRLTKTLESEGKDQKRTLITKAAKQLIGDYYLWGGRSPGEIPKKSDTRTGIDCSGLINLAYRACAVEIPRDAHEQFMKSRRIKPSRLKEADLIFLSEKDNPKKIVHVILYLGDDALIEAPGTGKTVAIKSSYERLGKSVLEIRPGDSIDGQSILFGTYLE